ncbi:MAG: DUF4430 domain-containing protein [Clostridia bacterium]|nr:DUF4430 domain-containing protein [Clostridia bacterium]
MKTDRNKIIAGVIIGFVLAFVFWWGGNAPGLRGWNVEQPEQETASQTSVPSVPPSADPESTPEPSPSKAPVEETGEEASAEEGGETATEENKPQNADHTPMTGEEKTALADRITEEQPQNVSNGDAVYSEQQGMDISETTGTDEYHTAPVPQGQPVPMEPEETVISDKKLTCTLSVRCDTVLAHMPWLNEEKKELIPQDGVIYETQTVTFYEGESVFNLLVREMKRNKIHLEFENTPIYNSAYIEGIGNLYEFDCGELSGWMYQVNGWFPNYGCSRYQLKEGDQVQWVYTCDLGADVGGNYSARNGK